MKKLSKKDAIIFAFSFDFLEKMWYRDDNVIYSCLRWGGMAIMRLDPVVRKETAYVAVWVAIAILPVQAVFLIGGWWTLPVLLGSLLGSLTAVGNVLMVGLMVQKAVTQTEKQAKNTVRLSQGGRLLLQGLILVLAACLPRVFNLWAAAIPLLVPRIAVSVRGKIEAKNAPTRPAIGWEDEDEYEDEDED